MNRKFVKQFISVIIFSAIPAFLSYLANSTLIFDKLIESGLLAETLDIPLIQDYCLWIGIVFSALAVGFGTMLLMKGSLPKKTSIYLEKLKIKLEQKIERGSKFAGLYKKTVNTINSFIQKTQSINNITSLKDILVQKLMYSNKYTKKVHKGITKFFNRISRKTVNSSYEKTGKKIAEFNEYILSLNERILKEHPNDNSIKNTIYCI